MRTYDDLGILVPEVYLPKPGIDPQKWAVIAVDQFTSEPEYWEQVEDIVDDAPSSLRMILPEIYLGGPDEADRIRDIRNTMRQYLRAGILKSREGFVLVERTMQGKTRRGLLLCLDLERYDYKKGSNSLIRATEETIIDRLPQRMKIREGAPLELPHILVLIDDPHRTVIEPLIAIKNKLEKLYEFDLMLGSGHIAGRGVLDEAPVIEALRNLAKSESPLLFAVGDGNHSLAAAKGVWERLKPEVGMNHPARYALVEIENIHDDALTFEPIHRVLYGVKKDFVAEMQRHFGASLSYTPSSTEHDMIHGMASPGGHRAGIVIGGHKGGSAFGIAEFSNTTFNLPVGTIQAFLDRFMQAGGADRIDYVHGDEVVVRLGSKPGHVGIFLGEIDKSDLFKTVIADGALPRKAFSMGEAREKRFYLEARKLS